VSDGACYTRAEFFVTHYTFRFASRVATTHRRVTHAVTDFKFLSRRSITHAVRRIQNHKSLVRGFCVVRVVRVAF
jgi:hypothetical protein